MPSRKGYVEPWTDAQGRQRFRARIHLADGSRPRVQVPIEKCRTRERAKDWATWAQEQEDKTGALLASRTARPKAEPENDTSHLETLTMYAKRWLRARKGRVRSVRDNESHLNTHILPVLGPIPMLMIMRADIETFVAALDAKVIVDGLSAKTANNVWGTCTKMFDDATNAKPAENLRCLKVNPTTDVRGPDDNDPDKILQFLYPSEFAALMACARVPLLARRAVAIAIHLGLRAGEQRALKWTAVDLEHGVVTVEETFDRQSREDREGTKNGEAAPIQILPELLPLLEAMHAEAKEAAGGVEPTGHVCPLPAMNDLAARLRGWLLVAGVTRSQLHKSTKVSKNIRWHDLRATCGTWLALKGWSGPEIRDHLRHEQTSTTDRYLRSASLLRGGRFGTPFPPLPATLMARPAPTSGPRSGDHTQPTASKPVRRTGVEDDSETRVREDSRELDATPPTEGRVGEVQPVESSSEGPTMGSQYRAALLLAIDVATRAGDVDEASRLLAKLMAVPGTPGTAWDTSGRQ